MSEITNLPNEFQHPKCDCHQCTYLRSSGIDKMLLATKQIFIPKDQESTKQKTSNE